MKIVYWNTNYTICTIEDLSLSLTHITTRLKPLHNGGTYFLDLNLEG